MARDPRRAALRRALFTRRAGWQLVAALALLGLLLGAQRLGWHRLTRAAGLVGHAFAQAARLALDAGWLLLLLAAVGLALGLVLRSRRGRMPGREQRSLRPQWLPLWLWQRRWWIALATLFILVWWLVPPLLYRHTGTAKDAKLKAITDTRTALLAGLIGVGALMTFWLNNRVYRITARTLQVTEQGQITERYTKAIEQLGHTELAVRLGGIYALERIAKDSERDQATIEEVLTAYVRTHAPWPPPPAGPPPEVSTQQPTTAATPQPLATASPPGTGTAGEPDEKVAEPQGPAADVQAAVTVLGRPELPPDGLRPLDLARVDLRRAQLDGANLQDAELVGANLERVVLTGANLQGARLRGANLLRAWLNGANLQDAELNGADLRGARLRGADLQGARLRGADLLLAQLHDAKLQDAELLDDANLQGAVLRGANLQGARLDGANLQRARLDRANLQRAWLFGAKLQGAVLRGADLQGAWLRGANLQGARANKATRWPDGFDPQTAGVTIEDPAEPSG